MSRTDYARPTRRVAISRQHGEVTQTRQPRPAIRRQGTRSAVLAAALKEA